MFDLLRTQVGEGRRQFVKNFHGDRRVIVICGSDLDGARPGDQKFQALYETLIILVAIKAWRSYWSQRPPMLMLKTDSMAAIGGMIELDSTVFSANQSQTGGAVLATGSSNINAGDVEYDSNQADFGGHIFISGGQYNDARSAFIGGQGRLGGSIAVDGGKATFANAQITHSNAAEQGGAAYLADGQLSFNYAVVYDNQAPIGGGIAQAGGDLTIRGMIASENIGEAVASASGDVPPSQPMPFG